MHVTCCLLHFPLHILISDEEKIKHKRWSVSSPCILAGADQLLAGRERGTTEALIIGKCVLIKVLQRPAQRYGTTQVVVAHVEAPQYETVEALRDRPRQLVMVQEDCHFLGETPEAGRDRPRQLVIRENDPVEILEVDETRGDGAGDAGPGDLQLGQEPELGDGGRDGAD
ncbi:hypothetical protein Dimus_001931 [Dionaea muscipula]